MTEPTRRSTLLGAAATALLPLAGASPAQAAAPQSGKQAPGWYRYKVGTIEVTVATDGAGTNPLSPTYVANATKDDERVEGRAPHVGTHDHQSTSWRRLTIGVIDDCAHERDRAIRHRVTRDGHARSPRRERDERARTHAEGATR